MSKKLKSKTASKAKPRVNGQVKVKPRGSQDVPATKAMVYKVRDELRSEMKSGFNKMEVRFKRQDARFVAIDARFDRMEARFKDIDARFDRMGARFKDIDARFDQMEARFKDIDARFDQMEARFKDIDARFDQMMGAIHKVALLVEEQNARNLFVLDGYTSLSDRMDRLEGKTP